MYIQNHDYTLLKSIYRHVYIDISSELFRNIQEVSTTSPPPPPNTSPLPNLKTLFNIVEAPFKKKKKMNIDVCVQLCCNLYDDVQMDQ